MCTYWVEMEVWPQTWTLFFEAKRKGGKPERPEKNPPTEIVRILIVLNLKHTEGPKWALKS
jgi:hypothetical protein